MNLPLDSVILLKSCISNESDEELWLVEWLDDKNPSRFDLHIFSVTFEVIFDG